MKHGDQLPILVALHVHPFLLFFHIFIKPRYFPATSTTLLSRPLAFLTTSAPSFLPLKVSSCDLHRSSGVLAVGYTSGVFELLQLPTFEALQV